MSKKGSTKLVVSVPFSGDLRFACMKLRGMAYLIELCGELPVIPLDEEECFAGIGLILTDINGEILDFAHALERWELHQAKVLRATKGSQSKQENSQGELTP